MRQSTMLSVAFLVALFFSNNSLALECRRPKEVLGAGKLELQNSIIDEFGIPRMEYVDSIRSLAESGQLLSLPDFGTGFFLDSIGKNSDRPGCKDYPYPEDLKHVHPAAHAFVEYVGEWWALLHPENPLKITGGIRTPEWQRLLSQCNGNAARGITPSKRSAHFSGLAIDYSKLDRSREEICDLWVICMEIQKDGLAICVDEEYQNNVHIFVHPDFLKWKIDLNEQLLAETAFRGISLWLGTD